MVVVHFQLLVAFTAYGHYENSYPLYSFNFQVFKYLHSYEYGLLLPIKLKKKKKKKKEHRLFLEGKF